MPLDKQKAEGDKKSLLGRAWSGVKWIGSGPVRAFPGEEVGAGGRFVGSMIEALRKGETGDRRFCVKEDNCFDLDATAFYRGTTVWQLEKLLKRRQQETARAAYLYFAASWLFFFVWLIRTTTTTPWTSWRIFPVLEFAPFCAFLFLMAFRSALQNYQIRTRRLATAGEYLATQDAFWPN
jgi:hypothetical protein